MRSYNTLFRQSPSRLDSEGSVAKPGSKDMAQGCTSNSTCDRSPNYDGANYDNDDSVSPSLVWSLQQELCQLSDALARRSKAVSWSFFSQCTYSSICLFVFHVFLFPKQLPYHPCDLSTRTFYYLFFCTYLGN